MRVIYTLLFCLSLGINLRYTRTKYLLDEVDGTAGGNHPKVPAAKANEGENCKSSGSHLHKNLPDCDDGLFCKPGRLWLPPRSPDPGTCISFDHICKLPPVNGPSFFCKLAAKPRFYFVHAAGQCKKFIYGGCGGNENNFDTKEICEKKCGDKAKTPSSKRSGEQPGGISSLGKNEGVSSSEENGGLSSSEENGGKSSIGSNVAISPRATIVKPDLKATEGEDCRTQPEHKYLPECREGLSCRPLRHPNRNPPIPIALPPPSGTCIKKGTNADKFSGRQRCQSCISGCKEYWSIGIIPNCCRCCNWPQEN